ncbi:MAG: DUF58 domain-containing protein [Gammaproteobacteria bacterium]|nr:DUF58 domain-containing protein [Gammaproteobacteria bacterium]
MNLTSRGIGLVMAAALLGALGQWSAALGSFPWWRLAVALIALGLLYELLMARRVAVAARWRAAKHLLLGRPDTLRLEIANGSHRALRVQAAPTLPDALAPTGAALDVAELHAGPGATAGAPVRIVPTRLGEHVWSKLPVRVRGPLGLAWWSRRLAPAGSVRVVPDTLGPKSAPAGSDASGSAAQASLGGAFELHHLRPYRPGDPRHTIDWKATARASRLITRVYSEDQHLEIVIAVDAGRTGRTELDGISQFGHYANLASRFAEYCVSGDDQVGLVVFADRTLAALPPGRGPAAVARIRRALTNVEPQPVESDVLEAALEVRRLVRRRCLVVVLTDLYERGGASRLVQTARLLAPKHLPMMVGLVSTDAEDRANAPAADWLDPYVAIAARDYRRQLGANVARLTRLGAIALTAHAADLDRLVLARYRALRERHRV